MTIKQRTASVSLESLHRVFTVPETQESTLGKLIAKYHKILRGFYNLILWQLKKI